MDKLDQIKKFIIETAPAYDKIDLNKSYTGNLMQNRRRIGFTRIFYPDFHIEGDNKIFDRRLKNSVFKSFRYFGPRGEILWGIGLALLYKSFTLNNIKRESIEKHFLDKNVFYIVPNTSNNRIQ